MAYNQAQLVVLRAEIDKEPANATRTDEEVLEWCKEIIPNIGQISTGRLNGWFAVYNLRPSLEQYPEGAAFPNPSHGLTPEEETAVRGTCDSLIRVVSGAVDSFNAGLDEMQAALNAAVAAGVITQDMRLDLEELSEPPFIARFGNFGNGDLPQPRGTDVTAARALDLTGVRRRRRRTR